MVSGAVFSIGVRDLLPRSRAGHQKKGRVQQLERIDLDLPVACRSVAGPRLCPLEIALLQSSLQMNLWLTRESRDHIFGLAGVPGLPLIIYHIHHHHSCSKLFDRSELRSLGRIRACVSAGIEY
jgi:hypothetical protein